MKQFKPPEREPGRINKGVLSAGIIAWLLIVMGLIAIIVYMPGSKKHRPNPECAPMANGMPRTWPDESGNSRPDDCPEYKSQRRLNSDCPPFDQCVGKADANSPNCKCWETK